MITITMPEEMDAPKPKKRPSPSWWKRLLDKLFHRYEDTRS